MSCGAASGGPSGGACDVSRGASRGDSGGACGQNLALIAPKHTARSRKSDWLNYSRASPRRHFGSRFRILVLKKHLSRLMWLQKILIF